MQPELGFRERVEALIGRYLRGEIEFDAGATELAAILRSLMTPPLDVPKEPGPRRPRGPLKIKPLTAADWMNPGALDAPIGAVLHAVPLVPGGSPEDEDRAQALFEEAVRRAEKSGGGAV